MTTETLSDKIFKTSEGNAVVYEWDVREFIKQLKEKIDEMVLSGDYIIGQVAYDTLLKNIDELAGKELVE